MSSKFAVLQRIKNLVCREEWAAVALFKCHPPLKGISELVLVISRVCVGGTEQMSVSAAMPGEFDEMIDADVIPRGTEIYTDRREVRPIVSYLCEEGYVIAISRDIQGDAFELTKQIMADSGISIIFDKPQECETRCFMNTSDTSHKNISSFSYLVDL